MWYPSSIQECSRKYIKSFTFGTIFNSSFTFLSRVGMSDKLSLSIQLNLVSMRFLRALRLDHIVKGQTLKRCNHCVICHDCAITFVPRFLFSSRFNKIVCHVELLHTLFDRFRFTNLFHRFRMILLARSITDNPDHFA